MRTTIRTLAASCRGPRGVGLAVGLWVALLLVPPGASAAGQWLAPVSVWDPSWSSSEPTVAAVATDPQDNAVAVVSSPVIGGGRAVAAVSWSAGQPPEAPQRLSSLLSTFSWYADVAMDAQGNAVAVWSESPSQMVKAAFRPAGGTWSAPQNVSPSGQAGVEAVRVAMSANGLAVATWTRRPVGGTPIVQAAVKPSDGAAFGEAIDLSKGGYASEPDVAVSPSGDAIVVWSRSEGGDSVVQFAARPAGGPFAPLANLTAPGQRARQPRVAMDPAGNATVVWSGSGGVSAAQRGPSGDFGVPQQIDSAPTFSGGPSPQVVVDADNRAVVAWVVDETYDEFENYVIRWAARPPGGSFGAPQRLSRAASEMPELAMAPDGTAMVVFSRAPWLLQWSARPPDGVFQAPQNVDGEVPGRGARVAFGGSGNAIGAWYGAGRLRMARYDHSAIPPPPPAPTSAWLQPERVSSVGVSPSGVKVAVDARGAAIAAWIESGNRIAAAYRPADATAFREPEPLAPAAASVSDLDVAFDGEGNATVIWQERPTGASTGVVRASVRPPGPGASFAPPEDLSDPSRDAGGPVFAVAQDGSAVAAWIRSDCVVEAATRAPGQPGFGAPAPISDVLPGGSCPSPVRVAVDPRGNAVAVWAQGSTYLLASVRPAGGDFRAPEVLAGPVFSAQPLGVALDARGNATAIWIFRRDEPSGHTDETELGVIERAAEPDFERGTWGVAERGPVGPGCARLAVTPDNRAVALSSDYGDREVADPLHAAVRPPGGSWVEHRVLTLDPLAQPVCETALAASPGDEVLALWTLASSYAEIGLNAARWAADGSFEGVREAIPYDPGVAYRSLSVALDDQGNATAGMIRIVGGDAAVMAVGLDAAPPTLTDVSVPSATSVGRPVEMAASATDRMSTTTLRWDFGDGTAGATGSSVSHAYGAPGDYDVTVTATDGSGFSATSVRTVRVAAPPSGPLHVEQTDAGCSDTGAGTTAEPLCTMGAAAARAIAGTTVLVGPGTYREQVEPPSGTQDAPVVFRAATGADVTVTGGDNGFYIAGREWVSVRGFRVSGTRRTGIYVADSSHIELVGNHISGAGTPTAGEVGAGVWLQNTSDSHIRDNTVTDNSDSGIVLNDGSARNEVAANRVTANARRFERAASGIRVFRSPRNTVSANVITANEDSGLDLYRGSNDALVVANVAHGNGDQGIDSFESSRHRIVSNSVSGNVAAGINLNGGSTGVTLANNISVDNGINSPRTKGNIRVDAGSIPGTTLDHDLVHLRASGTVVLWGGTAYGSLGAFTAATGQERHGLEADPRWTDPGAGDLHLTAGSPAIDAADSAAGGHGSTDADGHPRVDDPRTINTGVGPRAYDDRGAYEYPAPDGPPTASLRVTPDSGMAPLEVVADASASTDPDATPIDGYRFEFGDGTSSQPQATATARHVYAAAGTYAVTVTVTDTAGRSSTATAPVTVRANLIPNPGFEENLSRWNSSGSGSGVSLSREAGGHTGEWAAKVTNAGATADTCLLNDAPNAVTATAAGAYTAGVWVRSDSPGQTLKLRLREYSGSTRVGAAIAQVTLTTSWQQLHITYSPSAPGTSTLDYNAYVTGAPPGGCFYADDAAIQFDPTPPPSNLAPNAGFEDGLSGWNASGSTAGVVLAREPGGLSGGWAAKLMNSGTTAATCTLNDAPNVVSTTTAGTYTASLWVRAATAGQTLKVRLREYSAVTLVGSQSTTLTLTTSWQRSTVMYTVKAAGSSTLDLNAYVSGAPPGTCFFADDAAVHAP